jgi:predicted cobalt transporter CbtA
MVQRLMLAGMLSGLVVALFAFSFARVFSEPTIERAITVEENLRHDHPGAEDGGTVSRGTQRNAGLFTGIAAYCAAIGGFLAIGLACLHGHINMKSRTLVWALASAGYLSLVLVPQMKYPASPPGVGIAETIGSRTELYFLMILASAVSMALSIWLAARLRRQVRSAMSVAVGAGLFGMLAAVLIAAMPAVAEVPHNFPRGLLCEFRVDAALLQVIVWAALGAVFGQAAKYVTAGTGSPKFASRWEPNA